MYLKATLCQIDPDDANLVHSIVRTQQLTKALRALSAQYEQAQQQHAAQVETLRRQVEQLSGQVTHLARDYRTLAETLRGRWT